MLCQVLGHDYERIQYFCLYAECNQERLLCSLCIQSDNHLHGDYDQCHIDVFQLLDNFREQSDIYRSIFFSDQGIDQICKNWIVTIQTKKEELKPIKLDGCKFDRVKTKELKLCCSNNLMVAQDSPTSFKIWSIQNKFRLIKSCQMKHDIFDLVFSLDNFYLYIIQKEQIIQLNIFGKFEQTTINCFSDDSKYQFQLVSQQPVQDFILLYHSKYIVKVDVKSKKEVLRINTGSIIESVNIQNSSNRLVTINVGDGIKVWDSNFQLLVYKRSKDFFLEQNTLIHFAGDGDLILTTCRSSVIIWKLDLQKKALQVHKLIYFASFRFTLDLQLIIDNSYIYVVKNNQTCTQYCIDSNQFKSVILDKSTISATTSRIQQVKNKLVISVILKYFDMTLINMVVKKRKFLTQL